MLIAAIGVLGALAAFSIAEDFSWRNAYIAGGILGIILLFLRLGTYESGMFKSSLTQNVKKGKISMLFTNKDRFKRYVYSLLIGLPIWFVVGIFVTQAPEFGEALGAPVPLSAGKGIFFSTLAFH